MAAEPPRPDELRTTFHRLLNLALTRVTSSNTGLGPSTLAAIDAVAHEHPDAEAELIAAAYDAFRLEPARPKVCSYGVRPVRIRVFRCRRYGRTGGPPPSRTLSKQSAGVTGFCVNVRSWRWSCRSKTATTGGVRRRSPPAGG